MATPRKHWFRVSDSLLREPWPRDEKLTLVLLLAWLNQRWARDGLSREEACRAVLSKAHLAEITGRSRIDTARKSLQRLADFVTITIELDGDFTLIHFPKFSEFQNLRSEVGAGSGSKTPPPQDAPARRKTPPQDLEPNAARSGAVAPREEPEISDSPAAERWSGLRNLLGSAETLRKERGDITPDEADVFFEQRIEEIAARCESEGPSDLGAAIKSHLIASWRTYKKSGETKWDREFGREGQRRVEARLTAQWESEGKPAITQADIEDYKRPQA